jgi:hypothetical protein
MIYPVQDRQRDLGRENILLAKNAVNLVKTPEILGGFEVQVFVGSIYLCMCLCSKKA